jgi:hypothetical protein
VGWIIAHKVFVDNEHLCQTIWSELYRILNVHAPLTAIAQRLVKARRLLRGADQQHILNPPSFNVVSG